MIGTGQFFDPPVPVPRKTSKPRPCGYCVRPITLIHARDDQGEYPVQIVDYYAHSAGWVWVDAKGKKAWIRSNPPPELAAEWLAKGCHPFRRHYCHVLYAQRAAAAAEQITV